MEMGVGRAGRQLELRHRIAAVDSGRERTGVGLLALAAHSLTLMLARFITSVHLSCSCTRNLPKSSGVLPRAVEPSAARRLMTSSLASAARIAALSRLTIGGGVSLGANTPLKVMPWASG